MGDRVGSCYLRVFWTSIPDVMPIVVGKDAAHTPAAPLTQSPQLQLLHSDTVKGARGVRIRMRRRSGAKI